MFLVVRSPHETKTHCYLPNDKEGKERVMEFQNDFTGAYQDIHYLECCSDGVKEEPQSLSSITLSRKDKEI